MCFPVTPPPQKKKNSKLQSFVQNFLDAYSDAWKANSGVPAPATAEGGGGGSNSASAPPSTPAPPPPPPQGYEYAKPFPSYPFAAYAFFPPNGPQQATPSDNLKRPYPFSEGAGEGEGEGSGSKRSPRHCCKCGSQECKGKGGRSFCTNGCQDCGKLECKGRNSRRPDKKCDEGWL